MHVIGRRGRLWLSRCLAFSVALFVFDAAAGPLPEVAERPAAFRDDFSGGRLDPERWRTVGEGDVRRSAVDVTAAEPERRGERRLRLGMDTIGTRDDTVKYVGVRSAVPLALRAPRELGFDLDWNDQSNGSYLAVAVYLCPTVTDANPERERDWLRFEYIGVPPGQNARAVVAIKRNGLVRHVYTEGWPAERKGRHIGAQRIKWVSDADGLTLLENGSILHRVEASQLELGSAYLYLVLSSHSNYPWREVYFGNVSASGPGEK